MWSKVAISAKYFAISAIAAVLKFVEISHGISFALNSLRVRYEASEGDQNQAIPWKCVNLIVGCMLIDASTIYSLELIQNIHAPQSTDSFLGLLNNTLTPMGVWWIWKKMFLLVLTLIIPIGSFTTFQHSSAVNWYYYYQCTPRCTRGTYTERRDVLCAALSLKTISRYGQDFDCSRRCLASIVNVLNVSSSSRYLSRPLCNYPSKPSTTW